MEELLQWSTRQRPPELRRERRFHCQTALLLECVRRQTFANWPVAFVDPDQLAKAGFFYIQKKDHVQCFFCHGIVGFWDPGDQPELEHRRHFPKCAFVGDVVTGNVPVLCPADDTGRVFRLLSEYHAFRVTSTRPIAKTPVHKYQDDAQVDVGQLAYPQFNTDASRKQTFTNWEAEVGISTHALVAAGFFYTGISDWVQCFHCGGGLFCWRQGDDPATDHARYYPCCPFIRTQKGKDTISRMKDDNIPPSAIIRPILLSEEEANLFLAHPFAKKLIAMGLSRTSVKKAFRLLVEQSGTLCRTVTDALELVFEYEETQTQQRLASDAASVLQRSSVQVPENSSLEQEVLPMEEVATTGHDAAYYHTLLQEVKELQQRVTEEERRLTCRVCKVGRRAVVLLPCSHLHLCATCARPRDACPTCSAIIRGTFRPIIG
nr:baculoviral IAP repeat-containing protein 7-like [Procambarus clarkii]XP_045615372.1 baculoviral IAP repeat-containing protein 7-like [Procambarus clarkii]